MFVKKYIMVPKKRHFFAYVALAEVVGCS